MNANIAWLNLISSIVKLGKESFPRSLRTLELISHTSIVDMNSPIITIDERKLNYRFMFGEAYWILSGSNRVKDISEFMNNIAKFSDNGITFRGAYGPKVIEQLDYVIEALNNDHNTRQAVLNIWRENPRPSKDYPCTLNMQWIIREGKLHCITNMRSSDAWLGWVYDVFNFSMISSWIVIALRNTYGIKVQLGNLHLTAGSQHLYSQNIKHAEDILSSSLACSKQHVSKHIDLDLYKEPDELVDFLQLCGLMHNHNSELKEIKGIL